MTLLLGNKKEALTYSLKINVDSSIVMTLDILYRFGWEVWMGTLNLMWDMEAVY